MILGIETSAKLCSVAFGNETRALLEYNLEIPMQHAVLLAHFVEQGIQFLKESPAVPEQDREAVDLVAVAVGPGSFTGLRIGLSYAQGFCFGQNIPIVGISNHQLLAMGRPPDVQTVFTIIDARRDEVYLARLETADEGYPRIAEHKLVHKQQLFDVLPESATLMLNEQVLLPEDIWRRLREERGSSIYRTRSTAAGLLRLGGQKKRLEGADDLARLEPMYIRPFAGVL